MTTPDPKQRLQALDVMRGATILAMILVNNPGTWSSDSIYPPLQHATWHGWTPTDLVFPFFLFMVGVAMAYAFRKYEQSDRATIAAAWPRILRRTLTLVGLGLFLNAYGSLLAQALGTGEFNPATLRLPGVLQRIGLAYCGGSMVVLLLPKAARWVAAAVMLFGYAALLMFLPADVSYEERFAPDSNLTRAVDIAVLTKAHMYTQATSEPTEPEGLLSTLPSVVTVLIGYLVGKLLQRGPLGVGPLLKLALLGAALTAAGLAWDALFPQFPGVPINKKLWTSSFVLLTGGLGTLTLTAILVVFDWLGGGSKLMQKVAMPFTAVGVNAISAFVLASLTGATIARVPVGETSLKNWLYQNVFVAPMGPGPASSLAMAVTTVAIFWALMIVFYRRGWVIRV